jgi:hypothetical protein
LISIASAMDVLDVKQIPRSDFWLCQFCTIHVRTKLELSELLITVLRSCFVEACRIITKAKAVLEGE